MIICYYLDMRDTKELTVEEIIKELDEIGERVKSEMDQVGVAIITACPSTILWMNQADRDRQHALKMEYQSRGEQLRIEARERILLRRRNRKLKK